MRFDPNNEITAYITTESRGAGDAWPLTQPIWSFSWKCLEMSLEILIHYTKRHTTNKEEASLNSAHIYPSQLHHHRKHSPCSVWSHTYTQQWHKIIDIPCPHAFSSWYFRQYGHWCSNEDLQLHQPIEKGHIWSYVMQINLQILRDWSSAVCVVWCLMA